MEYIPSYHNQIARWTNLKYIEPDTLTCFVCNFNAAIKEYKTIFANDIFNFGIIKRFICPQCDVIFGDMKFITLDPIEIQRDYQDVYSYYKEGTIDSFFINLIQSLQIIKKENKIIDYGSGNKLTYHSTLRNIGYNIVKYDKYIKDKDMIQELIPETYDILFNHNVIEHVIEPYRDISEMISLIKKNGLLILSSSCWEYRYECTHYHTFFFVGRSVDYLCKQLNIELIDSINYDYNGDKVIIKIFRKK
jgi:hypothetical protein